MSDQPKPVTTEWTEDRITSLLGSTDGVEGLVYEINAALAAARTFLSGDTTALDEYVREKCQPLVDALKRAESAIRSEDHVKMGLALIVIRDRLAKVKEGK